MKKPFFVMFTTFAIMLSAGCQSANEGNELTPQTQTGNEVQRVKQTVPEPEQSQDPQKVAQRLAELATHVPQVHDATAIVFGNMAIVGIDVNQSLGNTRVGTIKYSVAEALKEDPQGARSIVTADADIIKRIKNINHKIQQGEPLEGFTEELTNIVGRLMPQLPKDVETPNEPQNARTQPQPVS